jgi:peptide/nickel transport system ATP-binding protein
MGDVLLSITDLKVGYRVYKGQLKVLNGVNIEVKKGERVGIVGETGSGKTTIAKSITGILPKAGRISRGKILLDGKDVLTMSTHELSILRGQKVAMIFQDPTSALNPVLRIGSIMDDIIGYAYNPDGSRIPKSQIHEIAVKALRLASLPDPDRILASYPFQLSGGMRQRVFIAMALATPRELLLADEPTTNLDVTIQDQILRLIKTRVDERHVSMILISHSLDIVSEMTDRVYMLYGGTVVEQANTRDLFENPYHPYSRALMSCIPKLSGGGIASGIAGEMVNYLAPGNGCRFSSRCSKALPACSIQPPPMVEVEPGHRVACFLFSEKQRS